MFIVIELLAEREYIWQTNLWLAEMRMFSGGTMKDKQKKVFKFNIFQAYN